MGKKGFLWLHDFFNSKKRKLRDFLFVHCFPKFFLLRNGHFWFWESFDFLRDLNILSFFLWVEKNHLFSIGFFRYISRTLFKFFYWHYFLGGQIFVRQGQYFFSDKEYFFGEIIFLISGYWRYIFFLICVGLIFWGEDTKGIWEFKGLKIKIWTKYILEFFNVWGFYLCYHNDLDLYILSEENK